MKVQKKIKRCISAVMKINRRRTACVCIYMDESSLKFWLKFCLRRVYTHITTFYKFIYQNDVRARGSSLP